MKADPGVQIHPGDLVIQDGVVCLLLKSLDDVTLWKVVRWDGQWYPRRLNPNPKVGIWHITPHFPDRFSLLIF